MKPLTTTKLPVPSARPALDRLPTAEERRRAQRVLLRISVLIHIAGKPPLPGYTHTVSASGAMIVMREALADGTKVTIENLKSQAKVEAKIARPPQTTSEGSLVPVEFLTPSPTFWNVFFPPATN